MAGDNSRDLSIFFSDLTKILSRSIKSNQCDLFNNLIELEKKFKESLFKTKFINEIYRMFILFIVRENKNILSAKPYFREKNTVFCGEISKAIKGADINTLKKFHINYKFISFIISKYPPAALPLNSQEILKQIISIRNKLITDNIPLAINRAKIFYRKVPQSSLALSDLIHISILGLIAGIDKYSGKHTRVFNGVCIGNMVGNMIKNYSDTVIKFYPSDKSILYRANSIRFKKKIDDIDSLFDEIYKSYQQDCAAGVKIPRKNLKKEDLANLMNAASSLSLDERIYDSSSSIDDELQLSDNPDPESVALKKDLMFKVDMYINKMPIIFQKVLKMKKGAL